MSYRYALINSETGKVAWKPNRHRAVFRTREEAREYRTMIGWLQANPNLRVKRIYEFVSVDWTYRG